MEYTEGQKSDIRKSFAARKRRQWMLSAPVFLLVFAVVVLEKRGGDAAIFGIDAGTMVPVMFLAIAGAIVFSLWNWRCPSCRGYLGKQMSPKYCSRCGVELQ